MKLILFDDTPIHKANFLKLVQEGKYNGTIFHRIIRNFMVQGGEIKFNNDSLTFIQKSLPSEIRPNRLHLQGALAAARPENPEKRSDLSQFYIVQNQSGTPFLNGNYTVFGQMLVGFNVLEKIVNQELNGSTPVKEIKMNISAEQVKRADIIKFYGDVYAQFDFK
jgi:cyclophilin family peptidyl-prolyl cis-trans isomerase